MQTHRVLQKMLQNVDNVDGIFCVYCPRKSCFPSQLYIISTCLSYEQEITSMLSNTQSMCTTQAQKSLYAPVIRVRIA